MGTVLKVTYKNQELHGPARYVVLVAATLVLICWTVALVIMAPLLLLGSLVAYAINGVWPRWARVEIIKGPD